MTKNRSFYFSDGPYIQVLKALVGALTLPEAFVKLVGNPHTGKSALCVKLTQYLRRKGVKVIHFDTAIESPDMLRAALAQEFDLPLSSNFARILEDALQDPNQKRVILIFDDAHLLTDITLIEIYRLAEVQVNKKRLLNILLCGEPSLEKRLLSNREFKSLLLNVSHKFKLEPMNDEELGQFFYRFVDKAGLPGLQLEQSAMSYFFKLCKGYPGPAANMCQLIVAARKDSAELYPVTKTELTHIFKSATDEQALPSAGFRYSNKISTLIPFAAVLLIVSMGLIYRQLSQPLDGNVPDTAEQRLPVNADDPVSPFEVDQASVATQSAASGSTADPARAAAVSAVDANFSEEAPAADVASATDASDSQNRLELSGAAVGPLATGTATEAALVQEALSETSVADVSDSGLALVTAEERGIDVADIAVPEFDSTLQAQAEENIEAIIEDSAKGLIQEDTQDRLEASLDIAASDITLEQGAPAVNSEPVGQPAQVSLQQEAAQELASQGAAGQVEAGISELAREETAALPEPAAAVPMLADGGSKADVETDASSDFDLDTLQQFVAAWVDAWQAQALESYFAAYHTEFEPRYQNSVPAWRSSRERVIGNAGWIELELSDFQYIGEEAGIVEVHFWLNYRSPTYQDETQKKLLLSQESGDWRILEEINLQVRS